MLETGVYPDFIVVDGKEGGTGAAPLEFADHIGAPLREGLVFVRDVLNGIGAKDRVRIGCSGKIVTAFDMAVAFALGADWCNSARGFMFSLGCIQSLSCHTDRCPTGVATQDPARSRALVVEDKTTRVFNFHRAMLHSLAEITAAAGIGHPNDFLPEHFVRRVSEREVMSFAELYPPLANGALLGTIADPKWARLWDHGGGRRSARLFDQGELRLVVLALIAERPRHGYEIIKEIEDRVAGTYSPSPGVIYPTLTMLEELGHATIQESDGKKLYAITPSGDALLAANKTSLEGALGPHAIRQQGPQRRSCAGDHPRHREPEAGASPPSGPGAAHRGADPHDRRGPRRRRRDGRAQLTRAGQRWRR